MNTVRRIARYQTRNLLRSRALLGYGAFLAAATVGLLRLGGGLERTLPSLASVVLLAVPLVSLLVTVIFLYEGRAFTELLLAQPVGRNRLFTGLYLGLTLPLVAAFLVGVGVPLLVSGGGTLPAAALLILGAGALLTGVFGAIGFLVAFGLGDATRGFGAALVLWLALTVVYDGVVLIASHALAAYPLERPMLAAMVLNPIDLARVLILTTLDAAVLLGYTGAVFQDFFGGPLGPLTATSSLALWVVIPWRLARRRFRHMDF